jgi:hypothetical protein
LRNNSEYSPDRKKKISEDIFDNKNSMNVLNNFVIVPTILLLFKNNNEFSQKCYWKGAIQIIIYLNEKF